MTDQHFDVVIIGGGVNGLATLYHLLRMNAGKVALIEQHRIGANRGSSHGNSRVTRSTYSSADYVRLMQVAHNHAWPQWEHDFETRLIHRCSGCFWGPGGDPLFDQYAHAVVVAGANVEQLTPSAARTRFPQFRFADAEFVLEDHTAGLIDAAHTVASLRIHCESSGATIFEHTPVQSIDSAGAEIHLRLAESAIIADRIVVAAGSWAARLVPQLASKLSVCRQTVGFFELEDEPEQFRLGRFPVWVYLHDGPNNDFYGLPEYNQPGIKLARHRTAGGVDDPDATQEIVDEAVADLSDFITRQFTAPIKRFVSAEHCLYTNTATEDFILDHHPDDPRVVIGAGFSGHGFKFAPITGQVLAELLLNGRTTIDVFEAMKAKFRI